ncbi:TerB N-terminal domain-containing protein [Paenibacillus polygoni]|uniref:TerB N-terminal domain-containing protein n=1 Tax=Paenibacillus polygoni TaxID=3050112 RepID=A0ABY8X0N9_9BACL|nr:TerB N-terminal domain-containing protein [Paenibacillus polygoni]WIV17544.1 TerB N-terminal domain-containing protein [Paenibacillus polygoni]
MDDNQNRIQRSANDGKSIPKQSIHQKNEIRFAEYEWMDEEKEAEIPRREDFSHALSEPEEEVQDLTYVPIDAEWDGLDFLDDMQVDDWNPWNEESSEDVFLTKQVKNNKTPAPLYNREVDPAFDIDKVKPIMMPEDTLKRKGNLVVSPQTFERDADWEKQFIFLTREQTFVKQAREFESVVCSEAPFVSYRAYWPTYEQMSSAQKRWYFYWRKEVKQGRYPDTDLSYLFLYIYELIHGVGWSAPEEGLALLDEVWFGYGEREKKIDMYMREWIFDFCLVHGLEMPYKELMEKIPRKLSDELKEREWMRRFTSDPLDLSWDMLMMLIDYNAEQSSFFKEQGRKEMKTYAPKVIALVDRYWLKKHGLRLIHRFWPEEVTSKRILFRSAVYDHDFYGKHAEVRVFPISEHPPLRAYLTQLVRFTENKLRELMGVKGRLRGVKLESEVEELVTRYLRREIKEREVQAAKKARPAVKINTKKLRRLQQESEEVRDMLTIDDNNATHTATEAGNVGTRRKQAAPNPGKLQTIQTEMNFGGSVLYSPPPADEDQSPNIEIWKAEETFVERTEVERTVAKSSVIEETDVKTTDVETTGEETHGAETTGAETTNVEMNSVTSVEQPGYHFVWNTDNMEEEWQELAERLSAAQLEVLYILRDQKGSAELQRIATKAGSMPELMIEEINEISMEIIGDILIDGEEITEEYIEALQTLSYTDE